MHYSKYSQKKNNTYSKFNENNIANYITCLFTQILLFSKIFNLPKHN